MTDLNSSLLLSICIRTYNQARFIRQALTSVLNQRTLFSYEIIVSDDSSIDGTQDILRFFQKNYSDKIRLILGSENVGGPKNLRRVIEASNAKYIVCLDGDDYFTDQYKLQKQVDFLEEHPNYSACFHNVMNLDEETNIRSLFLPLDFPNEASAEDIIAKKWFLPIHSVMMRRELISFPEWYEEVMNDDYVVNLSVAMHGPYYYMPDIMAVYRHHDKNISINYKNILLIDRQLQRIIAGFSRIYPLEYAPVFEKRLKQLQDEIDFYEAETRCPFRKWIRIKTYKRILRKWLRKKVGYR